MLDHVVRRLSPQVAKVVINANGDAARFGRFGLPVVGDPIQGFVGPLAGVLAGLRWAAGNVPEATHVLSVSSDAPFLPSDLAERLAAAVFSGAGRIAIARSDGELHPVIGLWPVALADDLEAALMKGVRKVLAWTDRHGTLPVDFPMTTVGGMPVDPFFNANSPDELEVARRILARISPPAGFKYGAKTQITGRAGTPIIAVVGWKKSGKTTLTSRLVAELTRRGHSVATVKHAHHKFQIDDAETDSARHRRAGAVQVAVVSGERLAIIKEFGEAAEPNFSEVVGMLDPCSLILVEGYKSQPIPKIEARRTQSHTHVALAPNDALVIAIAADHPTDPHGRPLFSLDDIGGLADLIERDIMGIGSEG